MTDTLYTVDGMLSMALVKTYPKKSAAIREFIFDNMGMDCVEILIDIFGATYQEDTFDATGVKLSEYREFSNNVKRRWYNMSTDREVDQAWEWGEDDEVWSPCKEEDEGAEEYWELWQD